MIPDPEFVDDPLDPFDRPDLLPAPGVYEPDSSAIVNQAEFDVVGAIHIIESTIEDNYAHHDGAGVANAGHGILTIKQSTLRHNTTEADGGAIYSTGGTLEIDDTTVSGNTAHSGGGIYSAGDSNAIGLRSKVSITNTRIAGNEVAPFPAPLPTDPANIAEADGGGMVLDGDAQVTLSDLTVNGNLGGDAGGGFSAQGRLSLVANRLTVTNNKTHGEGGGAYSDTERPVVIRDSTFSGNQAGYPEPPSPGDAPTLGAPGGRSSRRAATSRAAAASTRRAARSRSRPRPSRTTSRREEGGGISIDNFGP